LAFIQFYPVLHCFIGFAKHRSAKQSKPDCCTV